MIVSHNGIDYECAKAVKCEDDKYIKLYNSKGVEIAAFDGISNFDDFTISGGTFSAPCDCNAPLPLSTYSIGGKTISPGDWTLFEDSYSFAIVNDLISANVATCNIFLFFAPGTEFTYTAEQRSGRIILTTASKPENDIVIDSIQISRA